MAQKNLIKLARGTKKVSAPIKKSPEQKPVVKEVVKQLTPEEERDVKAKQRVDELLQEVDLSPTKNEKLLEIETPRKEGVEWLEEQISLLTEQNENLKIELGQAKEDYRKIYYENQQLQNNGGVVLNNENNDGVLKELIIKVFNELQYNYINMGKNQYNGQPNFVIAPAAFMNRLILFFPFLTTEKKF